MPLPSHILHSVEARESRAQSFYTSAQQRKLSALSAKTVITLPIDHTISVPEIPTHNISRSVSSATAPGCANDPVDIQPVLPLVTETIGSRDMAESEATVPKAETSPVPISVNSAIEPENLKYTQYSHDLEAQYLPTIRALISKDLSEPYSIYVYRYFLYQWGHLCYMALNPQDSSLVGVVICKLETHSSHSPSTFRGYIAMLAVASIHRGKGIATKLVRMAIDAMVERNADEIVLEAEESNKAAMRLYERLGFLRSKKLHRYYLSGSSAYRLVLGLRNVGDNNPPGDKLGAKEPITPPQPSCAGVV